MARAVPGAAPTAPAHINCTQGRAICTEVADSEEAFGEGSYVGSWRLSSVQPWQLVGAGLLAALIVAEVMFVTRLLRSGR